MGKSIKERIKGIKGTVSDVEEDMVELGKEQGRGIKDEYKDIEKIRHHKELIYYKTDALAIVVSEESGQISYIKNGEFIMYKDTHDLTEMIKRDLV